MVLNSSRLSAALIAVVLILGESIFSYGFRSSLAQSRGLSLSATTITSRTGRFENFDALFFDCDGVIAETERDVHRVTFNKAFNHFSLPNEWNVELYGKLLKIGGGKERMAQYFSDVGYPPNIEDKEKFIKELHKLKTTYFNDVIAGGSVPLRPGIARLMDEAFSNNIKVAVCSTSSEDAVKTVVRCLLGDDRFSRLQIFAGDVVAKKKPSPDVYLLASKTLQVDPRRCWVVEDSEIGLHAAKSAGMKCLITKSFYTKDEDFSIGDVVINNLDEGLDGKVALSYLDYKASSKSYRAQTVTQNAAMFGKDPDFTSMARKILKGEGSPFGM